MDTLRQDSNAAAMLPSGNRRGGAQTNCFDENNLVEGETPARGASSFVFSLSRYFWTAVGR